MKILDRVKAISVHLGKDKEATGGLQGLPLQGAAVDAAIAGRESEEWRKYMSIHASNEAQLKRLTGKDELANEYYVRVSSAYMVGNALCGGITPTGLPNFIDARIDEGLPDDTDPNFVRHLNFDLPAPADTPTQTPDETPAPTPDDGQSD
jgi:hypothetical protein